MSAAADDVRVQEARRRLAALPHDTELVGLGLAELVAWVARMHGAAQLLDAYVRDHEQDGASEAEAVLADQLATLAPLQPHGYDPDSHKPGNSCTYCGRGQDDPLHAPMGEGFTPRTATRQEADQ